MKRILSPTDFKTIINADPNNVMINDPPWINISQRRRWILEREESGFWRERRRWILEREEGGFWREKKVDFGERRRWILEREEGGFWREKKVDFGERRR